MTQGRSRAGDHMRPWSRWRTKLSDYWAPIQFHLEYTICTVSRRE